MITTALRGKTGSIHPHQTCHINAAVSSEQLQSKDSRVQHIRENVRKLRLERHSFQQSHQQHSPSAASTTSATTLMSTWSICNTSSNNNNDEYHVVDEDNREQQQGVKLVDEEKKKQQQPCVVVGKGTTMTTTLLVPPLLPLDDVGCGSSNHSRCSTQSYDTNDTTRSEQLRIAQQKIRNRIHAKQQQNYGRYEPRPTRQKRRKKRKRITRPWPF